MLSLRDTQPSQRAPPAKRATSHAVRELLSLGQPFATPSLEAAAAPRVQHMSALAPPGTEPCAGHATDADRLEVARERDRWTRSNWRSVVQEEQERNRRILAALEGEKQDLASRHERLSVMLDQSKVRPVQGFGVGGRAR